MKPILKTPFGSAVCAAYLIAAAVSQDTAWASGCNYTTIQGSYGYAFSGLTGHAQPVSPLNGVGPISFDGKGNFSGSLFLGGSKTGSLISNPISGTYTVNADCTDSLNGTNGTDNFALVIVGGGAEIFMVDLNPTQAVTIDVKKM
jgi:hypothetical protein